MTLIALIDRIRMLDNDLIRLNAKLDMVIQQQKDKKVAEDDWTKFRGAPSMSIIS